jgi:hypothetical protein
MSPHHTESILVCLRNSSPTPARCRLTVKGPEGPSDRCLTAGRRIESPRVCHVTFGRAPVVFVPLDHLQFDTRAPPVTLLVLLLQSRMNEPLERFGDSVVLKCYRAAGRRKHGLAKDFRGLGETYRALPSNII